MLIRSSKICTENFEDNRAYAFMKQVRVDIVNHQKNYALIRQIQAVIDGPCGFRITERKNITFSTSGVSISLMAC